METKKRERNIPIALDANTFGYLALIGNYRSDPTGEIFEALKKGTLDAEKYIGKPEENLPPILRNSYFGHYKKEKLEDGTEVRKYERLEKTFKLYRLIKYRIVRAYITPLVYQQIESEFLRSPFARYCEVIKIPDDEYEEFSKERYELAEAYMKKKAVPMDTNDILDRDKPTMSALVMAEPSMLGLMFVTGKLNSYINDNTNMPNGLHARQNLIQQVNKSKKYLYLDNNGELTAPSPVFISSFVNQVEKYLKYDLFLPKTLYLENSNLPFYTQ